MDRRLVLYKSIVDGLASLGRGVYKNWVLERGSWPNCPQNTNINEFLGRLDGNEKKILVDLLEQARDGGIHDTLVYLNDRIELEGLKLIENDVEMTQQPFGSELYYDWVCRRNGDPWPDEK